MKSLLNEVETLIDVYRGHILDAVEDQIGDSFKQGSLRSKLLKYLGDRGLEGKILDLIRKSKGGEHEL